MVFSSEDKAIIKNDYEEKGWTAYQICKEHKSKERVLSSVQRLLKRFKEDKSMKRRTELVEELICSQEDFPGTQKSPRKIVRNVGISTSSVIRLVKRRKINQFKRMKTPNMNNGKRDRTITRSGNLAERFDRNPRLVEKFAYQDEKDFMLEVPTNTEKNRAYFKGKKDLVPDQNIFHQTNKQSIKLMVSACLTWNRATKPFFVNGCEVKVNAQTYKRHLQKELLPAVQRLYKHKNWIFVQDNELSHRSNPVQDFIQETLN